MNTKKSLAIAGLLVITSVAVAAWKGAAVPRSNPGGGQPEAVGGISGRISFEGTPPAPQEIHHMSKDPVCAAAHKEPVYLEDGKVNGDGTVPDAFIYIKSGAEKLHLRPPSPRCWTRSDAFICLTYWESWSDKSSIFLPATQRRTMFGPRQRSILHGTILSCPAELR